MRQRQLLLILLAFAVPLAGAPSLAAADAQDISVGCPAGYEDEFPDVRPENLHEAAIDCIVRWGISTGSRGYYRPAEAVTRAQMASFMAAVLDNAGRLPWDAPDAFSDDDGNPHEDNIDALAALGIVGGTGAGRYSPKHQVSRGQMAAFLVRTYDVITGQEPGAATLDWFDDDDASPFAGDIDRAADLGFVTGTAPGTYAPLSPVRREQMASFVARLLSLLLAEGHLYGVPDGPIPAPGYDPHRGHFAFLTIDGAGAPVRFDPCRTHPVVANLDGAPPGAEDLVRTAIAKLNEATGMSFVYAGRTSETVQNEYWIRQAYQPDRYGDRWAPVLVSWPAGFESGGWVIGTAHAITFDYPGWTPVHLSGAVNVLRTPAPTSAFTLAVIMHELGHVVGLDHSLSANEIMYASSEDWTEWGPGDRAGLRALGRAAGCLTVPRTSEYRVETLDGFMVMISRVR